MIVNPGRSEPIEKYAEVIGELLSRGFCVLIHDWRGQGLSSPAPRGRFFGRPDSAAVHLRDLERLLEVFGDRLARPWLALAHSMGAGLTLLALAHGERRFVAAALSAPMILIRTLDHPPARVRRYAALMHALGRGAISPLPRYAFERETFETNILTHDPTRWARNHALLERRPELRPDSPDWSWLAFALKLAVALGRPEAIERVLTPVIVVAAGDDRLCINEAAVELMRRAPEGRYVEIEGAYHEILMETDEVRGVFWREFDALTDRIAVAEIDAASDA